MYESFTIEQIEQFRAVTGDDFVCDGDRHWAPTEDEE